MFRTSTPRRHEKLVVLKGVDVERLRTWMTEPLILSRWMLYVLYGLFVTLGVVLAIDGLPVTDFDSASRSFFIYGLCIAAASTVALVGSVFPRHPVTECVADLGLFSLLTVYIMSTIGPWVAGDTGTGALGVVVMIASGLPFFRCIMLANGIIRKWASR